MADAVKTESPDVATRTVVTIMAGIVVLLIAIVFGFEAVFQSHIAITKVAVHDFPAPGVRPDEGAERQKLEAQQRARLDGSDGRMPIEAAMRAIASKGPRAFDPIEEPR